MKKTIHNPQAFPVPMGYAPATGGSYSPAVSGMSLLDHYAGLAMQSLLTVSQADDLSLADSAYKVAKAMLVARSKL